MYKRQVLGEIKATIGKVAKFDFNTNNGVRGRFARMAIFINLDKPLISQVIINGVTQRIKYEHLSTVCFQYGHYGHTKEICPKGEMGLEGFGEGILGDKLEQGLTLGENKGENSSQSVYDPWMLVEKKAKKISKVGRKVDSKRAVGAERNSRF
ncbi:hypothetical protein PVK06_041729 [Gossypium arboreum]|uniref:Zinc knuckle CX2CX4HX4C domain-containing protein n=1 Tax=Gossypium arboreum TaxID=29729 RepID=A0ABR0N9W3_GOSAR|nr:hypothetical protein PVK06_041729 [Gossypium arboreum]